MKIAESFKRLQLDNGTWYLMVEAKDLADTIVFAQQKYHDGRYLTYLITVERDFWVNCAVYNAKVMLEFADAK